MPIINQQPFKAMLTIPFAGTPYRSRATTHSGSNNTFAFPSSHRQDNSGSSDLIPRQGITMSRLLQVLPIVRDKGQQVCSTTTHVTFSLVPRWGRLKRSSFQNLD